MSGPLVVAHRYPVWLGTTLKWLYDQIRLLPPEIESHVICERTENLDRFPWVHLHALEKESRCTSLRDKVGRRLWRNHLRFTDRVCREVGAAVLHSHFGDVAWGDVGAAKRANIAHIATFYGVDVRGLPTRDPRWYRRYLELFESVDRVLCEGPFMAAAVAELGCPPEKITVKPLGLDVAAFEYRPRQWRSGQPLRVLMAGSFREKKGFPDAIEALGRLKRLRPKLNLQVTILGDATPDAASQAEKTRILGALEAWKIEANLLGYRPHSDLMAAYGEHDLFLSPSRTASDGDTEGGAPVSIIEAAAVGMAIGSTTHADIPFVLPKAMKPLLAPEGDAAALAQRLDVLLDTEWAPLLDAQRKRVEQEFSGEILATRLAGIYREVGSPK